jgi:hypothetical protein
MLLVVRDALIDAQLLLLPRLVVCVAHALLVGLGGLACCAAACCCITFVIIKL